MRPVFSLEKLRQAPFSLDDEALDWVKSVFSSLGINEKLGQILLPVCRDLSPQAIDGVLDYHVGGLHRMIRREEEELRGSAAYAQSKAKIPLLMACDIEFSEKSSPAAGTLFPNQMAVAATSDPVNAYRMGAIAAREGRYLGFSTSWTPVADLAINFHSTVVNTRAFGDRTDDVASFVNAYHDGARENGFATCLKHWPGDGLDTRDQHFVTTHNTMGMHGWRSTFGRIFRDAIDKGVQIIMSGHITLRSYSGELGEKASSPAHMPASLNEDLNIGLLRGELGFNGVIVSDATGMVGFEACGSRDVLVPLCIESGCDILLFPKDIATDFNHLKNGLGSGALSQQRVDEAVLRILALKASLGLHKGRGSLPETALRSEMLATEEHGEWSNEVARRAVTRVKDTQSILPLDVHKHRRILLSLIENRMAPSGPLPELAIGELLREAGFDVTILRPGDAIDADRHDIGIYVMAEEGMSAKEVLGPRWGDLHGLFPASMERLWNHLPTIYVSLGSPFLLYHMPECRTFVNAYSAVLPCQKAVVEALTGKISFTGKSPVDTTCGLPDSIR
ncbi:glycoside hydrolase family 3 protein [Agrobacterium sp. T29]|uniref:glycoside hydrolase family 3 protein n=1 Tax=Agrobacterium sp. T29 TaxID=2580515 RepID=UPI00115ED0B7|nr:glycoside hydrolase family 3 N-terminal domain-containing protein [Agrobacterium sp. T29]